MGDKKVKIVAMASCCMDVYPETQKTYIGGNSVNFAYQCKRSGVEAVSVVGCVGTDDYGEQINEYLCKHNIDISHLYVHEGMTASNRIYISSKGDRYFKPDSWNGGVYQSFELSHEDWNFVKKHDIVAIPSLDPSFQKVLTQSANIKIVVDFLDTRDLGLLEQIFLKTDIAFLSGNEKLVSDVSANVKAASTPVVITLGSEGSLAFLEGKSYFQEALPVDCVVDTTGCGDAYQAAFTVTWYQEQCIKKAQRSGAKAAAKVLAYVGAVPS